MFKEKGPLSLFSLVFRGTMFKDDPTGATAKWRILVYRQNETLFEVHEETKSSLFDQPMATGRTLGIALANFMSIEQSLIDKL